VRALPEDRSARLTVAAAIYLAANLLHGADHLRQHLAGVDADVLVGGFMITAAAFLVFLMARARHPRTPLAATIVGFGAAVLVAASHLAPHWSALSDSYINDIHPDLFSWVVVLLEIVAGLGLGVVGLLALRWSRRRRGGENRIAIAR
jgi:hypothetical protein